MGGVYTFKIIYDDWYEIIIGSSTSHWKCSILNYDRLHYVNWTLYSPVTYQWYNEALEGRKSLFSENKFENKSDWGSNDYQSTLKKITDRFTDDLAFYHTVVYTVTSTVIRFNWWSLLTQTTMVKSIMMPPLKRWARWSWSASTSSYWQQIGRIKHPAINDNKLRRPTLPPV